MAWRKMGGRPAAPVNLGCRALARHPISRGCDFARDHVEVALGKGGIASDQAIARAEVAKTPAERHMHVEREWPRPFNVALGEVGGELRALVGLRPDRRRGIAGIAGAWSLVACEDGLGVREIEFELFAGHDGSRAGSAFAASTKARTPATGVSGKTPWPRFST